MFLFRHGCDSAGSLRDEDVFAAHLTGTSITGAGAVVTDSGSIAATGSGSAAKEKQVFDLGGDAAEAGSALLRWHRFASVRFRHDRFFLDHFSLAARSGLALFDDSLDIGSMRALWPLPCPDSPY